MAKKYIVDLNEAERAELVTLTQKGKAGARKIKRAHILLMADAGKSDKEISELLHSSWLTVLRTRRKFVEGGLEIALNELPRAGRLPKIDDKVETILTTLAQSQPPDGRVRWTLHLLADRLVTLTHLDSLSHEAVRLVLKKTISSPGRDRSGASRPSSEPNLSGAWKTSWTCMPNLLTLPIQSSVLMKCPIKW